VAEDIDARKACYFFRAVTPEDYFLLQIKYAHPDLQAVEDVAVNLRILKGRHGAQRVWALMGLSAEKLSDLREWYGGANTYRAQRERVSGAAQKFWSVKGLGYWHVGDSKIARESYLQNAGSRLIF
jgi:hypothetical protein